MSEFFGSILIVEDENNLGKAIEIAVRKLGIANIRRAQTIARAREMISEAEPEIVLLDRNLPDGDGLDLCSELRDSGFHGSVLMLTAVGDTEARVEGLNAGADDYLAKPFAWSELDARIKALSRRRIQVQIAEKPGEAVEQAVAAWERDEPRLRIRSPKGWVQLTPLEFRLAAHLMDAKGAIVSREELLKDVWGFTLLPKTRTVDHFLGRLRKYFEENPEQPKHFITIRSVGYQFQD
jgi:DNA-binding response OmpR family regulator